MKSKIMFLSLCMALLSLFSAATLAYRTVYGTAENVIVAGNISLLLHIVDENGNDTDGKAVPCLPGRSFNRTLTVENAGAEPLYARLAVEKYVLQDSSLPADNCIILNVDDTAWTYSGGYYYYNKELQPGEISSPLFTTVDISGPAVDNRYLGKDLMLDVDAFAVQSKNNAADALSAMGWPA